MTSNKVFNKSRLLLCGLAALALSASPSLAKTYDLCASDGIVTMPDSTDVPIWGYVDITGGGPCTAGMATLPGPELRTTVGDNLIINLSNSLSVPVSLFVPGYRATVTGGDPGMLSDQVAAAGTAISTATYTISPVRAGTYLYHSGTDITTQVPMGLYGALVVDAVAGQAYADVPYAQDRVLVYSEIDPNLNADPAGFGGARVINWNPQYFLVNGKAHPATADIPINSSGDVLLRFVNAGLQTIVPTLDGGLYMDLKAEDGNRYPQPLQQYGIELAAGKTIDALINTATDGTYALYDRAASYHSGITNIVAGVVAGAPTAVDDSYSVAEDGSLTADGVLPNLAGVLGNDTDPETDPLTAILGSDVSSGTLVLNSDGSFTYGPNKDFSGNDIFTYVANDSVSDSNVATVSIIVTPENDPPVAVIDGYEAVEGVTLDVAAPGVLANDTDIDGDSLTAMYVSGPVVTVDTDLSAIGAGVLSLIADGSFTHDPSGTGLNAGDQVTFDYVAHDGTISSASGTVTLSVVQPAANTPPFANDDFAETTKGTAVTFSVTANDVDPDPDGSIDPATVVITTGANTQRGGTVMANGDGWVTYTPKKGFRGTDLFRYTVNDDAGATSNEATVRINVTK